MAKRHAEFNAKHSALAAVSSPSSEVAEDAARLQAIENAVANIVAAWTPTTCSTNCPSHDTASSVSYATPTSPTTIGIVVPELCCFDPEPVAETEVLLDSTPDSSPAATTTDETALTSVKPSTCCTSGLDEQAGGEDPVAVSSTPGSAPTSFIAPPGDSPTPSVMVIISSALAPSKCSAKCLAIVNITKLDDAVSQETSEVGAFAMADTISADPGDHRQSPWPPPHMCTIGLSCCSIFSSIQVELNPWPGELQYQYMRVVHSWTPLGVPLWQKFCELVSVVALGRFFLVHNMLDVAKLTTIRRIAYPYKRPWYEAFDALVLTDSGDLALLKFSAPLGSRFTTTRGDDFHSDPALLPWPSYKCSQFWILWVRQVTSEQRRHFSYWAALHTRAILLQRLRVHFVDHERQTHDKTRWGVQKLGPSWSPPEPEILKCHTKEAAGGWTSALGIVGRILLHPIINAILYTFPRLWIASKHVEVQSLFPYPPLPVNCHFARMHFMLYRRVKMNEKSNCVQGYSSSGAFLHNLNGRAEVQQHYTCTGFVTEVVHNGWISHHILRGNTHYADGIFWCELFSIWTNWDGLQYEHLQQWRPPDRVILLACMVFSLLRGSVINLLGASIRESENWFECVCCLLGTYVQEGLHYCSCVVGVQHSWELSLQITSPVRATSDTCHMMLILWPTWDIILIILSQPLSLHRVGFSWIRTEYPNYKRLLSKGATHFDSECFAWEIAWSLILACCAGNNQFATSFSTITLEAFLLEVLALNWVGKGTVQHLHCGLQCPCQQLKVLDAGGQLRFTVGAFFRPWDPGDFVLTGVFSAIGHPSQYEQTHFWCGNLLVRRAVSLAAKVSLDPWPPPQYLGALEFSSVRNYRTPPGIICLHIHGSCSVGASANILQVPTYWCGHYLNHTYFSDQVHIGDDHRLGAFFDQIPIGDEYYLDNVHFLNLIQVHIDHGYYRDYYTTKEHDEPWDPGGSAWSRLGVKPKIKEGGLLATSSPATGLDSGPPLLGLGCVETTRDKYYKYKGYGNQTVRLGLGWLRPSVSFLCFWSSSSSPRVPLSPLSLSV